MRLEFGSSFIEAGSIEIGRNFQIGSNCKITVRGNFRIGDFGRFGDNVTISAQNVSIGRHFYHYTPGLTVGGGGSQFSDAHLVIGDRCVLHNNYINLARDVYLGNDVGLSPDVQIITHGFWNSILEGFPVDYLPVSIDDGVIVGQRSMILPGVTIGHHVVIGANSTVTNSEYYFPYGIYAGSPAKLIRFVSRPTTEIQEKLLVSIIQEYKFYGGNPQISVSFPEISLNGTTINVLEHTLYGPQSEEIDKLRDFLRRYGIRIYTERPFISL